MFNKELFSEILKEIIGEYESSVDFAEKSGVNRTYISKYINMSLDKAPSPTILKKLSNNSKGIISYYELMIICGHIDNQFKGLSNQTFADYLEKMTSLNEEEDAVIKKIINHSNLIHENKPYELIKIFDKLIEESDLSLESKSKIIKAFKSFLLSAREQLEFKNKHKDTITPIQIPVVGKISAGQPILAEENFHGYEFAPSNVIKNNSEYFYLKVTGDSMNMKFNEGDLVLVQKQENLENGEIGVIRINGYDATVKKFKIQGDLVILEPMSTNPQNEIQVYHNTDDIHIIGKVVSYMGKID